MMNKDGGRACTRANSIPVNRLCVRRGVKYAIALHHYYLPEFFRLVYDVHRRVHRLHAEHLVVALLIVEHGSGKVIERIVDR